MIKTLVEPPLAAPVSLADVKSHLRFDRADEDDYLAALVLAATTHVERRCDIALMTQTWRLFLDDWPCGSIVSLPLRPVREIAEVIGRQLNVPVTSIPAEQANEHFGFLGGFFGLDMPA